MAGRGPAVAPSARRLALVAMLWVCGVLAAPHAAAAATWAIQPVPSPPPVPTGNLTAVSCSSVSVCTAVGSYETPGSNGTEPTLAEQWNGSSWSVQSTPSPQRFNSFDAVSCTSASACTAVGQFSQYGQASGFTLAERWDGSSWSVQSSRNPLGSGGSVLLGVSCTSATDCTAVGFSSKNHVTYTLAENWDGSTWSIEPTPSVAGAHASTLDAISCTSATNCTAVGSSDSGTLAEIWDGTSWSMQTTPNPAATGFIGLSGVSCPSASACTAVGNSSAGTFAEAWDGSTWSIQSTANPGGAALAGVSCTSASACLSVGKSSTGTLAEVWNGSAWSTQATPNPSGGGSLAGVSCPDTSVCVAVGATSRTTLVERQHRWGWSVEKTPVVANPVPAGSTAVSCPSPTACISVGSSNYSAFAEGWDGANWSIQPSPKPHAPSLGGVSCLSATACTAVAFNGANSDAPRWNGSSWSTQPTPVIAGASGALDAVACPTLTDCTAVGVAYDDDGVTWTTLAERWNGSSWSVQPTPSPAGHVALTAVSCTSPRDCTAVGNGDFAARWNGKTWSMQTTPVPAGAVSSGFSGVSCTSPSACTAVGWFNVTSGPTQTLAERWDGASWMIQPTPNPAGTVGSALNGVSCSSATACTAVGTGGLIEAWDSSSWTIEATPPPPGPNAVLSGVSCTSATVCTAVGQYFNSALGVTAPIAERSS